MTSGWIVINAVLAVAVSAIVAGIAVLVPHRLHRHALRHDARYAQRHAEPAVRAMQATPHRRASTQRNSQAA
jgi:hypothetical protein